MAKVGLFYGTQTSNTQTAAEMIQKAFGGSDVLELHDISKTEASDFAGYHYIVIGCPTWSVRRLNSLKVGS